MAPQRTRPSRGDLDRSSCKATRLAIDFYNRLNSPVSRQCRRLLKSGDHSELVKLRIDPTSYSCPDSFWRDYAAVSLMSKFPKLTTGIDTLAVALEGFKANEVACAATNRRLRGRYDTPTTRVSGDSLIETARRKIAHLLGDFSWDEAEPLMGFSSGASTRLPRRRGDAFYKFQGTPEVTRNCAILAICAIWRVPRWADQMRQTHGDDPFTWVKVVQGNRITTVPKNSKTDRVIAIEPDLNMFLQKGIGGVIRSRLKRVGVDLDDQTANQDAALIGSRDDSLATIDLRAASDSVSLALCERLLPSDWLEAVLATRCSMGTLPSGEAICYEKVSSMGNGFTFELESLIFWGLASAVLETSGRSDHQVLVYGDDIIVPKWAAGWLIELLSYVGFDTNTEKSFIAGPFRESCGKHYFRGIDVTPFYIDAPIDDISRLFWFANSVRRWASRPLDNQVCDPRFKGTYDLAVSCLPPKYRDPVLPDGVGDGGLIGTLAESRGRSKYSVRRAEVVVVEIGRKTSCDGDFALLRALMNLPFGEVHRARTRRPSTRKGWDAYLGVGGLDMTTLVVNRERRRLRKSFVTLSRWEDAAYWP